MSKDSGNAQLRYDSQEVELKWVKSWEENGVFRFNPKSRKVFYSIDTPPPTVSGRMHIGHSSSYTQMDVIARYKRMRGFEVFYPFGTDDNGLPTERLVEKLKGVKGSRMPRDEFIKLCWATLKEITPEFVSDWKRIGMSCDFSLFYSTIDEHSQRVSQKSFIDLLSDGRVYRSLSPTIWCPCCETAIAQVELEDKELDSLFVDLIFKVKGKDLIISTTRPEMLGACVAVFVHPGDKRYKSIHGLEVTVPLYNHKVKVIPDERVNPDKGSGAVMCCTFGDQTDIEWFKQYSLPAKVIINRDGRMSDLSGEYASLSIVEARKKIIVDLEKAGVLVNKRPIKHVVNVHERCGTSMEILISDQWFIKYLDLRGDFLRLGSELNWFPGFMRSRYDNWVNGLRWDWCISRQRFFGIPFPVWYCSKCGGVVTAKVSDLPVDPLIKGPGVSCPKCGCDDFVPEKDVMDTWATSSLTPTIAASLVSDKLRDKLLPMNLRSNAHDIITFWLFNTVVKSFLHYGVKPWSDVIVSGWVLDSKGKKMSKSKGNVILPQDILKDFSADALRFWATSSSLGEDVRYNDSELRRGQRLVNKLWNAGSFISGFKISGSSFVNDFADDWVSSRINSVIKLVTDYFDAYNYSAAKKEVVDFFWNEFCDYYLEMIKYRLYGDDVASRNGALRVCRSVFEAVLKLLAPFIPFITEELFNLFYEKSSIHVSSWPVTGGIDLSVEAVGVLVKNVISQGRQYKVSNKLSQASEISKAVLEGPESLNSALSVIAGTLKIKDLEFKIKDNIKLII